MIEHKYFTLDDIHILYFGRYLANIHHASSSCLMKCTDAYPSKSTTTNGLRLLRPTMSPSRCERSISPIRGHHSSNFIILRLSALLILCRRLGSSTDFIRYLRSNKVTTFYGFFLHLNWIEIKRFRFHFPLKTISSDRAPFSPTYNGFHRAKLFKSHSKIELKLIKWKTGEC